MMQHPGTHNNNPYNIPKQSKSYPIQSKPDELEDEPMPIDYKKKVKTITSLNNLNNRNFELINNPSSNPQNHNQNQVILQSNNEQNYIEEEEKPQRIPQIKNYSQSIHSNLNIHNNNQVNKSESNRDSAKFNNFTNLYNNSNENHVSDNKLKSDKSSTSYNEAAYSHGSGTNLNKANTTEYALNNSNHNSNHYPNSYSMRQNKISGHTYTKLAERMKSGDKKFNNNNNIPYYTKSKNDSQRKFNSEILNNLNNQLNQKNNNITNNNEKENTPVNHKMTNINHSSAGNQNKNMNCIAENILSHSNNNESNNRNQTHMNSAADYCKNEEHQIIKGAKSQIDMEILNDINQSPGSFDSKNTKTNQTNMQIDKLDQGFVSQAEVDQSASLDQTHCSRQKNSTFNESKFNNTNKAHASLSNPINNMTEKEIVNNYNPNLVSNKFANLKKYDEEIFMEPSMQKLDYSLSDDQPEQNQKAVKVNSNKTLDSNPNAAQNTNNIFNDKSNNNTNFSVSGNNQNSNINSINNTHSNLNVSNNNYHTTNNLKTHQSSINENLINLFINLICSF